MSVPAITSFATAADNKWNVQGAGTGWYAEKPVQCGGKVTCCSAASADLIVAMQNAEYALEGPGTSSPKSTSFNGHI